MLDRRATALIKPALQSLARVVRRAGLNANQLTMMGFCVGMVAAVCREDADMDRHARPSEAQSVRVAHDR